MPDAGENLTTNPVSSFSHLDSQGRARMVDVGDKELTRRHAVARGRVNMLPETASAITNGKTVKGDVLAVARIAAIQAAKRTSELIPLCHQLMISAVHVDFELAETWISIEARVDTVDRTGVEMEALTACSVAALTIYDMCKSADRSMTIDDIALWEKTGGKSGTYQRHDGASNQNSPDN